jgi:hypothetical protein
MYVIEGSHTCCRAVPLVLFLARLTLEPFLSVSNHNAVRFDMIIRLQDNGAFMSVAVSLGRRVLESTYCVGINSNL